MPREAWSRSGAWDRAFLLACALVFILLAVLGRSTTFWLDDWAILSSPIREGWTLDALMLPHNDHWQLTQVLVWKVLQSTVGLGSHLPYLLPVLLMHIAAALAVYGLARRQAGPFIAFAAGLLFLLLGTGGEVFFFAAAFNLVAATALGTWALFLFLRADPLLRSGRRRSLLVAVLLLVAVMSGGSGLYFLPAVAVIALLVPGRRRELWVILPATLMFVGWQLTYGSSGSGVGAAMDPAALPVMGDYIRTGVAHSVGAVTGLEDQVGLVLAVALLGATAWNLLGHRPLLLGAAAGAAGLLSAYAVTGLARADLGPEQAAAARYVYTTAPLVLLMISAWLGTLSPIDPRRPRVTLTVAVFLAIALTANLAQLDSWQQFFVARATETRAAIGVLLRYGGAPALPADRAPIGTADLQVDNLPDPSRLRELFDRYGSPLDDPFSSAPDVTSAELERALLLLVGSEFRVAIAPGLPDGLLSPEIADGADVDMTAEGSCTRIMPSGPAPFVTARVPNGAVLYVRPDSGGALGVQLSRTAAVPIADVRSIELPAEGVAAISIPDLADDATWLVGLTLPADGASLLCSSPSEPGLP